MRERFWPWCEVERLTGVKQLSDLCNKVRICVRRAAYDCLSGNSLGIRLVKCSHDVRLVKWMHYHDLILAIVM